MHRVRKGHLDAPGRVGGLGIDFEESLPRVAVAVDALLVNGVGFLDKGFCQAVKCVAGAAKYLFAKRHQPGQAAAGNARKRARLAIGVEHQNDFVCCCAVVVGTKHERVVTTDQHILVNGGTQADRHRSIGRELCVDTGKVGEFLEQEVALVEQVCGLCIQGLLFGELLVHHRQVGGEFIDLGHRAVHGLPGFQLDQVELGCELTEALSNALSLAQEAAAHDGG